MSFAQMFYSKWTDLFICAVCALCVCLTIFAPFNGIPSTGSFQTFSFPSDLTLTWFQSPNQLPMFSPELFLVVNP